MKKLYSLIIFLFLLNAASAQKPVAGFIISHDTLCAFDCTTFIDTSVSGLPVARTWSVIGGDVNGTVSPGDADTVLGCFLSSGLQSIKLVVTNNDGADSIIKTVYVFPAIQTPHMEMHGDSTCIVMDSSYASVTWYYDDSIPLTGGACAYADTCGYFSVLIVDTNGCTFSLGINGILCTVGIEETSAGDFAIYPNPVLDKLFITTKAKNGSITIFNTVGEAVLSSSLSLGEGRGEALDVSGLPAGIYFLQLKTENEIITKKFIKQ